MSSATLTIAERSAAPSTPAALSSRFVWGKKIEREIRGGGDAAAMTARAAAQRAAERAEEIEKVKRRRLEREEEKAQREKEAVEAALQARPAGRRAA